MAKKSKLRNFNNETRQKVLELNAAGLNHGLDNQAMKEPVPFFEKAPSEDVISGQNNSMIIMGRDRPSVRSSGYGGRGGTQCGRIDLIAGLASSWSENGPPGKETIVNPNFSLDAARVYISQKADIDHYMGIAECDRDHNKASSEIGMKADCVRIFGRKNIKIVTGKGRFTGMDRHGERNSSGGKEQVPGTISFIAGNYTEDERRVIVNILNPNKMVPVPRKIKKLQSLVKGENLVEALEELLYMIGELNNAVGENNNKIRKLAQSYFRHIHNQGFPPGVPTTPPLTEMPTAGITALQCIPQMIQENMFGKQVELFKNSFLKQTGPLYINSRHVYTT